MSPNHEREIIIPACWKNMFQQFFYWIKASFSLPWSERSYIFEITKNETSIHLVALDTTAENNGKPGRFHRRLDDRRRSAHRHNCCGRRILRRKGIAQLLISAALQEAAKRGAEKVFLEVRAGNLPAQNLYLKLGFIDFDLRKKYYVITRKMRSSCC